MTMKYRLSLCFFFFLFGCAHKTQDPFFELRTKNEQSIFSDGKNALLKKDYHRAAHHFEAIGALYPLSVHAEQALLNLLYADFSNKKDAQAMAVSYRFLRLYPRSAYADYVYYVRGLISMRMSSSWLQRQFHINAALRDGNGLKRAEQSFKMLVVLYPKSRYAPEARQKLHDIHELFGARALDAAEFYWTRHAYLASIQHAREVIDSFSDTASFEKAQSILINSYAQLGLRPEYTHQSVAIHKQA